jgi:hypothetical protein
MPADDRVLLFGHWYRDQVVRTPDGWRISKRRLELCFHAPLTPYPGLSPWTRPFARPSE